MNPPPRAPKLSSHLGARYHAKPVEATHWLKDEQERAAVPHSFTEEPPAHVQFTKQEMEEIRAAIAKGSSAKLLAQKHGVSRGLIWQIQTGAIK